MSETHRGPVCLIRSKGHGIDLGTRQRVRNTAKRTTGTGASPTRTPKERARKLVHRFKKRNGKPAFSKASRRRVADELLARIDKPWLINQGASSLCGPTSLVYGMAKREPVRYVEFVIHLFEHGWAPLGDEEIRPRAACRHSSPQSVTKKGKKRRVADADWIPLASLRDNFNKFLTLKGPANWLHDAASITLGSDLASWFETAGFADVKDESSTLAMFTQDKSNLDEANKYVRDGFHVCLLLDPDLLNNKDTVYERHWVVLEKEMSFSQVGANAVVDFTIFTWGGKKSYTKVLPYFLDNYYGFVACKF